MCQGCQWWKWPMARGFRKVTRPESLPSPLEKDTFLWVMHTDFEEGKGHNFSGSICIYIKKQRHHFADIGSYSQNYGFSSSHVWMWELDHKEGWMLKNRCFWIVMLEKTLENPLDCKEIKPVNPKGNQFWIFIGRTTWCKEPTHWKRPWCWERLRAGGEGGNRGWGGWMASPTRWTWVWESSRCWWWTGKPGVLQYMGLQRLGHDWATELNWTVYSQEWMRQGKACITLTTSHDSFCPRCLPVKSGP